ncbi:MAG: radical SAM protein [Clostridia bacterium]|nr:radical SAM protein [Clostridia bacterium]
MGILNKIAQYRELKSGVKHCTFNPDGPGVVRIHLIPPKFRLLKSASYIVILNGYYLLPLGYSWAIMLSAFMKETNEYSGREISDADYEKIIEKTVRSTLKVYPFASKDEINDDLSYMLDVIFAVARGQAVDADIERMSIRSYSGNMYAPHRMDLMVSAMTDGEGRWKCNQKCLFCYAAGEKLSSARELSTDEWKRAIDKLKAAGVPMLTFTGGEPTQREDIAELIGYSKWFVTRLNTNGVLLSEELCSSLCEASLDSLQITLYSHDGAVHNSLVGAENFAKTVEGIKNAVKAGLDVSINTPLCRKNADYSATLEFIHSLGVRFVTVSGLICTGMAEDRHGDYDLSRDELCEILRSAKEYCNENSMEIDFTSPGLVDDESLRALGMNIPMCGACLSNMAIAPDGSVIPCQSWLTADAALGNILDDSFKSIWNSESCKKLRGMSEEEAKCCPFRKRGENG